MNFEEERDARALEMQRIQEDVTADIQRGIHPFVKVRALARQRERSQYSTMYFREELKVWGRSIPNQIEDLDQRALEASMPIWDCGIEQLSDGFHISANIERRIMGGYWVVELFMNLNTQEDYETWSIMSKLGGIPDLNQQ